MKQGCVILAAGVNSRLDTGKPKSLLKFNHQTLIERHISLFSKSGINEFCVVTGYKHEMIEEEVERLQSKYSVEINTVFNAEYNLENGYSVWSAHEWVKQKELESFILTMADHVFDPQFINEFVSIKKDFTMNALYLAVDRPGTKNAHIDIEDVTKVEVKDSLIQHIGKRIEKYNYYDTGLFEMHFGVMAVFEECFDAGKYSISHMVESLAARRKAAVIDVSGFTWNDVDNPDDYEKTLGLDLD